MLILGSDPIGLREVQQRMTGRYGLSGNKALEVAGLYYVEAPRRGLFWTLPLAQAILETDVFQSSAWALGWNAAGIKWGPNEPQAPGPYRSYLTPGLGVVDHCNLLAIYAGVYLRTEPDTTRVDRLPAIIEAKLDRPYVLEHQELGGIWAEVDDYGDRITRVWQAITGR